MITFFSIPKTFAGESSLLQRNAIKSWRANHPTSEIILLGNDSGVREMADEVNAIYVPEVQKNQFGTPILRSAFQAVETISKNLIVMYLNADIILPVSMAAIIDAISLDRFLMIGKRTNLRLDSEINFSDSDWASRLIVASKESGYLGDDSEIDYFIFKRNTLPFASMPAFVVGRPCWDNWLVYQARLNQISVIDTTDALTVIHQAHGYSPAVKNNLGKWVGPESDSNLKLAGDLDYCFSIGDANLVMTKELSVKKRPSPVFGLRRYFVYLVLNENHIGLFWFVKPFLLLRKCIRKMVRRICFSISY